MVKRSVFIAFLCCAVLGGSIDAYASDRSGHWETTVQLFQADSEDVRGSNDSSVEIDGDVGFGVGVAYNMSNALAFGFDFTYTNPDYKAVFNTDQSGVVSIDHDMDVYTGQFSAVWNLMNGPFTPFFRGGIGWTYIDSNVSDGPPVTGCWWDPWYGYICQNYYDSYDDTSFSYGVGAGVRYEFDNGMFLKGSINHIEIDADKGFDPGINSALFELGWIL